MHTYVSVSSYSTDQSVAAGVDAVAHHRLFTVAGVRAIFAFVSHSRNHTRASENATGLEKEGERTSFLLPLQESFSHP